ncbi:MAG: flagellar hook-associated protein FlgL [Myxococcota bacterium]
MRISDKMITSFVANKNAAGKASLFEAIGKATSGQAIVEPADDPAGAIRITEYDRLITRLDRYQDNLDNVDHGLRLADQSLVKMVDILGEAKSIAIQMSNDTMGQTDYDAAAQAVIGFNDQLLAIANTRLQDGRYLFGGVDEDTPPYDATGNYQGSLQNRDVEIASGVFIRGTTSGNEGFGDAGGQVFNVVNQFVADLQAGNAAGIDQAVGDLNDALDFGIVNLARIGARGQYLDEVAFTNDELQLHFSIEKARFEEVDLVSEYTKVSAAETALNSIVELSSRLLQTSLLSFLR